MNSKIDNPYPGNFVHLRHNHKMWDQTLPLKRLKLNVFFTRLPLVFTFLPMFVHVSERENFFQQLVANLPLNATALVRFLETFEILAFFEKKGFFTKLDFFKIARSSKFAVECVSNGIIA